ncbi:MAG TPA: hypothetical protein VES67_23850 [Vicinamibacterales bacterium]|nr:hypothetical protein [Vicinamibacterales bacterium]
MRRVLRASTLLVLGLLAAATLAHAQTPPSEPTPPQSLRIVIHCPDCDTEFLKTNVGFAEFVADAATAEVDVTVSMPTGTSREWRLAFAGRGRFAGRDRAVMFSANGGPATEETRRELARCLKLGLAEYAFETGAGPQLNVTFKSTAADAPKQTKDPWNYWVFRMGMDSYGNGEQSNVSRSYYFNLSANRTTENWKIRVGGSRSLNKNTFDLGDGEIVKSSLSDWNGDTLIVKSVTGHFSVGLTASVSGSSFSNEERVAEFAPGVEFDVFPYKESTKRSLTFQYTVGGAHYDYEKETIFDKLTEKIAKHTLNTSLGLRQPWGQAGGSFVFTQQLSALERTRLSVSGSISVRLVKGLTVNSSGSYARIRDQFTLDKGEASEEEVLLRQRQLATGHRYSFSVGFSFSFGALSNVTVNPRFSL